MNSDHSVKTILFFLFVTAALVVSYPLLSDFLRVVSSTDTELRAGFVGAAPEDIFGFGFWPTWFALALVEVCLLGVAWSIANASRLRYFITLPLVAFVVTSAVGYLAYSREYALWLSA